MWVPEPVPDLINGLAATCRSLASEGKEVDTGSFSRQGMEATKRESDPVCQTSKPKHGCVLFLGDT